MLPVAKEPTRNPRSAPVSSPSPAAESEARSPGINLVRTVAVAMVVCAHCRTGYFFHPEDGFGSLSWRLVCLLSSVLAISLPLFFLISGFVLLKPGVKVIPFYRGAVRRIFIPLICWSIIYLLLRKFTQGNRISVLSMCRLIYNGEAYYHLWFLYTFLGIYLAIPILSAVMQTSRTLLWWFAGITMLLASVLPALDQILTSLTGVGFHCAVNPGFFWISAGYVVIGLLCNDSHLDKKGVWAAGAVFVASVALTFSLTSSDALLHGKASEAWLNHPSPAVVAATVSAFLLLKGVALPHRIARSVRRLSTWSFGIYLCHPLVLDLIIMTGWTPPQSSLVGIPLLTGMVLIGAVGFVAIISRIPVLRRIV